MTQPLARKNLATAALLALAAAVSTTAAAAPPLAPEAVMRLPAPAVQRYPARDGAELAFRRFEPEADPASAALVAILIHGSGGSSLNMTLVGEALAKAGVPAFALDIRGQGLSGRHGDIDYIGQQDNDLAEFLKVVRKAYPTASVALVGHSAGGGFVLRIAGEPEGRAFSRFVLLAPVLGRLAPTNRPDAGWAKPDVPKIAVLTVLNGLGVTAFNGATVIRFQTGPEAAGLNMTTAWSYRMMSNFGPHGQTQLFGRPGYLADAERAAAPITVIAGAQDQQFYADRYAAAFAGLARSPKVEIAPNADHMGVLSDSEAIRMIVAAVKGS
jgi:alpha-beta hydrolase superfamily lysophospholipase